MAIKPPITYPIISPNHTPLMPKSRTIPNNIANNVAHIASLITVKINECVPFPKPWNAYVEIIPPGNVMKNHAKI